MANTYTLISSATVGSGGAAYMEFTNIPQTYTDLTIFASARTVHSGVGDYIFTRFNGSTTGYTSKRLYAYDGSNVGSGEGSETGIVNVIPANAATASVFGYTKLYIPNYTSSNYKSVSTESIFENNSASANQIQLTSELWSNTSAITSIRLTAFEGNFAQYSTAYLYGISNA